jgi:hypothetical protein
MTIAIETLLRKTGLLEGMDERTADALLGRIAVQTYEPGAFLVTEGEIGDAAFVLLDGSLQVLGSRPDGSWIPLSRLEPGALFGEQALLGRAGGRRAATVRAIGPVTVARIGAREFHEALPREHPLRKQLVRPPRRAAAPRPAGAAVEPLPHAAPAGRERRRRRTRRGAPDVRAGTGAVLSGASGWRSRGGWCARSRSPTPITRGSSTSG